MVDGHSENRVCNAWMMIVRRWWGMVMVGDGDGSGDSFVW